MWRNVGAPEIKTSQMWAHLHDFPKLCGRAREPNNQRAKQEAARKVNRLQK